MNTTLLKNKVSELSSLCTQDILRTYNIKLIHDGEMNKNKMDSMLKILDHHSIIFMKNNLEERYENFLLFHEIGHFLLHYENDMKYSFYLARYKNRLEKETNTFACYCLLQDEDCEDVNIIDLLKNKGVPEQIAIQFYEDFQTRTVF